VGHHSLHERAHGRKQLVRLLGGEVTRSHAGIFAP
jgi:hypothetical protein